MRATNPGTWTEPAQAPVLPSMKQVAAMRAPSCRCAGIARRLVENAPVTTLAPIRWALLVEFALVAALWTLAADAGGAEGAGFTIEVTALTLAVASFAVGVYLGRRGRMAPLVAVNAMLVSGLWLAGMTFESPPGPADQGGTWLSWVIVVLITVAYVSITGFVGYGVGRAIAPPH